MTRERPNDIRFEDLDPAMQRFLRDADPDDVLYLKSCIKLRQNVEVIGKFGKWLLYTVVAGATLAATFGDSLLKMLHLWRGTP